MKYHASLLSDKLRVVLNYASSYDDDVKSKSELATLIFEDRLIEFSYAYRADDGEIRRGYTTPYKIVKYIAFLQEISLLNDDFDPVVDPTLLGDQNAMNNIFADIAKDILSKAGTGVQRISQGATEILRDDHGTLPTLDELYDHLSPNLSRWRFRWLVSLYSLGSPSMLRFRQSPLLLPRKYSRAT